MRIFSKIAYFACFCLTITSAAAEIIEEYRLAKFQQLSTLSELQKTLQKKTVPENELTKLELLLSRKIKIETTELRKRLDALSNKRLDLQSLPKVPTQLLNFKKEQSRLNSVIDELETKLDLASEEHIQYINELDNLNKNEQDLRGSIENLEQELNAFRYYLELLDGANTISDPELVSKIDTLLKETSSIEPLITWYSQKLEKILYNDEITIVGRSGKFENVPQGKAYLLWNDKDEKLYDINDFKRLDKIKYPAFKPIQVDLNLEAFYALSEETFDYSKKLQGKAWIPSDQNPYVLCTLNKAFPDTSDSQNICRILFPEVAKLPIRLNRDTYESGADGYLLSARAASEVSQLLDALNNEIKMLLTGVYPASFVEPLVQYFSEQKTITSKKINSKYVELARVSNSLLDTKDKLIEKDSNLTVLKESIGSRKAALTNLTKKLTELQNDYDQKTSAIVEDNQVLIRGHELKISEIQQAIEDIEQQVRLAHTEEISVLQQTLMNLKATQEKLKKQSAQSTIKVNSIEKRLPDAFASEYIKNNLRAQIKFTKKYSWKTTGCYTFDLNGKFFLTQPQTVRLAYKGDPVPDAVARQFFSGRDPQSIAIFQNKFNEYVRGITPKIKGYRNITKCEDFMTNISGEVARYFDEKSGNPLNVNNWSLIVEGVELGLEDDLRTSGSNKYQRATANQIIFKEKLLELKNSIEEQFKLVNALSDRLIDFESIEDITLLQTMLANISNTNVIVDGVWGQNSNTALIDVLDELGYRYQTSEDWSLELQKILIHKAFFDGSLPN